jgi:hypothetical protein
VQKVISFEQFDLRDSPAAFDAVLCRKRADLFRSGHQKRIVGQIRGVLRGCPENLLNVSAEFEKRVFGRALFHQACSAANVFSLTTSVEERPGFRKLSG